MPADFDTAIRQFEAGQRADAADTCRKILSDNPGDLSANNMLGVIAASQGEFSDAVDCFRACARAAPDDIGVTTNLAQALLEIRDFDEALSCFKQAAALRGKSGDNLRIFANTDMDADKAARGEPYVHTLHDVRIESGYWGIQNGNNIHFRESANLNPRNSPLIEGRVTQGLSHVVADIPPEENDVETPCIFLGGDENYAHWLTRYLMRLALIENDDAYSELPFLTIDSLKPFQRDSLELLGIDRRRLIELPRHSVFRCAKIVVPTCLRTDKRALGMGVHWLRSKFLHVQKETGGRRLFVSRRDAPSRYLTNEEQIVSALDPLGFQTVRLSEHSFAEQVAMFSNAEIVVAPHGAGLANMIFAPTDCVLVEIVSGPISNMNDFRLIGAVLGQAVTMVESETFEIDAGATNPAAQHSFTVNPDSILAAVVHHLH